MGTQAQEGHRETLPPQKPGFLAPDLEPLPFQPPLLSTQVPDPYIAVGTPPGALPTFFLSFLGPLCCPHCARQRADQQQRD